MNQPLPKKKLGQHWLEDKDSLLAMCDGAEVSSSDIVLEIGPGLGSLTDLLVKRVKKVIAVEFDDQLAKKLDLSVKADNLEVVSGDILKFDLTKLPKGYKVVANIPYYLTSNLLRVLSESSNPPLVMTLLVQKEVATRIAADAGGTSILSLSVQYFYQVNLGPIVKAELFNPVPKVDSQIVILKKHSKPLFKNIDEKLFFRVVRSGFASRRKTLNNSLSAGLRIDKNLAAQYIKEADIDPLIRAQELTMNNWYKLYKLVEKSTLK